MWYLTGPQQISVNSFSNYFGILFQHFYLPQSHNHNFVFLKDRRNRKEKRAWVEDGSVSIRRNEGTYTLPFLIGISGCKQIKKVHVNCILQEIVAKSGNSNKNK